VLVCLSCADVVHDPSVVCSLHRYLSSSIGVHSCAVFGEPGALSLLAPGLAAVPTRAYLTTYFILIQ